MSKTFEQQLAKTKSWNEILSERKAFRLRKQEEEESIRAVLDFLEHKDDYERSDTYEKEERNV